MDSQLNPCRICRELEIYLRVAEQPATDLSGLSEAATRNRDQQHKEQIAAAKQAIDRHNKAAHGSEERTSR